MSDRKPSSPAVIAEIACGHEGEVSKFFDLVDAAKDCGACIIKSQIFLPEERASSTHPEWDVFNKLLFLPEEWNQIVNYARSRGLKFMQIFLDMRVFR